MNLRLRRGDRSEQPTEPDDTVTIARISPRSRVRIRGQVVQMRQRPASGLPSLVITISDGTGRAVAVWSGRRALGGVTLGRSLVIEGIPVATADGPVFHNPTYTLLA